MPAAAPYGGRGTARSRGRRLGRCPCRTAFDADGKGRRGSRRRGGIVSSRHADARTGHRRTGRHRAAAAGGRVGHGRAARRQPQRRDVVQWAVRDRADLVVAHHPLPFRPVARITDDTTTGRVLLDVVGAGIGVWSSHTAWDSAAGGVNDQLAELLRLEHVTPIEADPLHPLAGFGRTGQPPAGWAVGDIAAHLRSPQVAARLGVGGVQVAGDPGRPAGRVAVVCGSGGDAIDAVHRAGCTTLVTGEIRLHSAVDAVARGLAVIALGHHASERFSMETLARRLSEALPGLHCWASREEAEPLRWI
ncbi:MAG: Nif3-like dinuclear metal center hexameric protein [Planctomycetia bacterium]|nr:Nif3-like dinuclear metal center hexameric protein [Planctomycetia bacterium]